MSTWTVEVGRAPARPIQPDHTWSLVHVDAASHAEAVLLAAQMVAAAHAVMPTSTLVIDWPEGDPP